MKYLTVMSALAMLVSGAVNAAAKVEITWQDPEKYHDVKPTSEPRKKFRERVFSQLDEYLVELAADLPDGQTLKMTVTDLDLAGQVWPASFVGLGTSGSDVRLIKQVDIPRMSFSYQLVDDNDTVLKEAEVAIKDMGFQSRNPYLLRDSDPLRYEKTMIRRWFNKEFPALTASN